MAISLMEKIKSKWTVRKEENALIENLRTLEPTDEGYDKTLAAVKQIEEIRNERANTRARVIKDIALATVATVGLVFAYAVDKGEDIPTNKKSGEMLNKILPKL